LTCGPSGPNPRPNRPRGWTVNPTPWLAGRSQVGLAHGFVGRCLHKKRKAKVVETVPLGQPAP
jgi:hypothetical protein